MFPPFITNGWRTYAAAHVQPGLLANRANSFQRQAEFPVLHLKQAACFLVLIASQTACEIGTVLFRPFWFQETLHGYELSVHHEAYKFTPARPRA